MWVWNCRLTEGYPGDAYVDVISVDIYLEKFFETDYASDYRALMENTTSNKVAALAEVGYLPDLEMLAESNIPWAYFMNWSKEWIIGEEHNPVSHVKKVYASEYAITL